MASWCCHCVWHVHIVLGHGFVLAVHGFVLALMALVPAGAVFDERFEAWMREELVEMRTPHGSVIEVLSFCKKDKLTIIKFNLLFNTIFIQTIMVLFINP